MTEKRFTVDTFIENYPCGFKDLEDNECEIRCDGKPMTYREVTDLLNKLHKENKELKYHLNRTEKELKEYKEFMSLG